MRITLLTLLFPLFMQAQAGFEWHLMLEGLEFDKKELFDKTAFWIADSYKDSKNVVQLKDQDNGIIVTKGELTFNRSYMGKPIVYRYSFTMNFQFKDNRCKVDIDKVYCAYASNDVYIKPYETDKPSEYIIITKKQGKEMMDGIKSRLSELLNDYSRYIKSPEKVISDDW